MPFVSFDNFKIPFSSIERGIEDYTFSAVQPDLKVGEEIRFPHEIHVNAHVTRVDDDFLVDINVQSKGEFICDRCSSEFSKDMKGEVHALFSYQDEYDNESDVHLIPKGADGLNISQDTLDALALSVPVKILCHEECLGLCSRCGINLNTKTCSCGENETDSRWEALKNIPRDDE